NNLNEPKIQVEGTTFDKEKVLLELFNRQTALKPKLGLQLEINRSFSFFTEIGYLIPLTKDEGLLFSNENKNGALGRISLKKQTLDFSNMRLDFRLDGQKATQNPYTTSLFLNVGIKGFLRFR
ncbi:MAG: hypothetical protein SFU27_07350, partial [Thermonemataceae bacterium]|nr:hypothetical protein [Thermonemataceae bacterium]